MALRIPRQWIELACEVTEFHVGHRLIISSTASPVGFRLTGRVEPAAPAARAARAAYHLQGQARGALRLAEPAIAHLIRRYFEAQARHVRTMLDSAKAAGGHRSRSAPFAG